MKTQLKPLLAALLGACLTAGPAHAELSAPELKLRGFGTLSAVASDERQADFAATVLQPNGAGFTRPWSVTPDTRLGGQLDAIFNDRFSAVLQVVAQHHHDNSFTPAIEWANFKFQATEALSLRAGRIAAPTFLISETRLVGYSQPWIRPPVEVYGVLPTTSNDGVDATYRHRVGSAINTVQAFYGTTTAKFATGTASARPAWGVNDTVQLGDLTLRAGYSANEIDMDFPSINALRSGLAAFTAVPGPVGAQANALLQRYPVRDVRIGLLALGASYDPGQWFVLGEFVQFDGGSILSDSRSWYVSGGWRFGSVTPYATYARTRADIPSEPGLPLPAAAPLNAGLNGALNSSFSGSQATLTLGVRWDLRENMALKAQYDRIDLGANSAGRLVNVQPGFARGSTVNLFSVALDFVF